MCDNYSDFKKFYPKVANPDEARALVLSDRQLSCSIRHVLQASVRAIRATSFFLEASKNICIVDF